MTIEIENIFLILIILFNFILIIFFDKIKLFHINLDNPDGKRKLHKKPIEWQKMLEDLGCEHVVTKWTARRELLLFGKFLFANKLVSYMVNSAFVSIFKKV